MGESYLVDTNVLLRFVQPDSADFNVIQQCVLRLYARECQLFYTSQNLSEFWNVCTRPVSSNGVGLTVAATDNLAITVETTFSFAPDSEATHRTWRSLVRTAAVSGIQVHDARLIASMRVHGINHLLTMNTRDFRRYGDSVISPQDCLSRTE